MVLMKSNLLKDNEDLMKEYDYEKNINIDLNKIDKKLTSIEWNASAADKNGFDDYMLKEIFEQPTAIRETIGSRLPENEPCNFDDLKFSRNLKDEIYLNTATSKLFINIFNINGNVFVKNKDIINLLSVNAVGKDKSYGFGNFNIIKNL